MYCEKCGKTNPENQTKCKYCGTLMPQKTFCGGFGDILSYENSENSVKEGVTVMNTAPVKTPEKASPLAPILSIVAIGVSVVAIILSISAMMMCANVDRDYEEEPEEEMNVEEEENDILNNILNNDSDNGFNENTDEDVVNAENTEEDPSN